LNRSTVQAIWDGGAYQIGWFVAVLGAAAGHPWWGLLAALPIAAIHFMLDTARMREARRLAAVAALGLASDSLMGWSGVLRFEAPWPGAEALPVAPPWLVGIWIMFAGTFGTTLKWLSARPWLAAGLGAVLGPLAYGAGARLGAAAVGEPVWANLLVLAGVWAVLTPLLFRVHALTGGAGAVSRRARPAE
jgi:hypothetical protein